MHLIYSSIFLGKHARRVRSPENQLHGDG